MTNWRFWIIEIKHMKKYQKLGQEHWILNITDMCNIFVALNVLRYYQY